MVGAGDLTRWLRARPPALDAFLLRAGELVQAQGRDDTLITGGGIIPKEDVDALERRGIGRLFGPGTPTTELIEYIKEWFATREKQEA